MAERFLITGGAGFIGSHVVDQLLEQGKEVSVLDIKKPEEATNLTHVLEDVRYVRGDIRDRERITELAREHTHILHLAAIVSVPRSVGDPVGTHETNVDGTLSVFEAARSGEVQRVVYASSAAVYGDPEVIPTPETVAAKPNTPYGLHKHINEQYGALYSELYGLSTVGLRFFNVYGARQDPSSPYSGVISIFARAMAESRAPCIYGDGEQSRDFVHVHDVARACIATLTSQQTTGAVYNVGTGTQTALHELLSTMNRVLGTSIAPAYELPRTGDVRHSCAVIDDFVQKYGVTPTVSLEDGLHELLKSND